MEQSALVDKNTLYKIYKTATDDKPYSFLFVELREHDVNKNLFGEDGKGNSHQQRTKRLNAFANVKLLNI